MKEVLGNIWDFYEQGKWITITTNGCVKSNGEAIMGKGIAKQAKQKFANLPNRLGELLLVHGNKVHRLDEFSMISFPVKDSWREIASLELIEQSCIELVRTVNELKLDSIWMVRPGCGNGYLDWDVVKPILERHLDDRFVIVEFERRTGEE